MRWLPAAAITIFIFDNDHCAFIDSQKLSIVQDVNKFFFLFLFLSSSLNDLKFQELSTLDHWHFQMEIVAYEIQFEC